MLKRTSSKSSRRAFAVEAMKTAGDCIGPIEHDMSVFGVTRGQFSMIDCIQHTLGQLGAAHISVWTWAIADYEVEVFTALMLDNRIKGASLVIDISAERRNADLIQQWRDRFGPDSVRICKNHAKIARVWNDDYRVLLRGSMNLNFNPRFEQLDVTEGGPDFDLVSEIEAEMPILPPNSSNSDADHATGLTGAFDQSVLNLFPAAKVWAK